MPVRSRSRRSRSTRNSPQRASTLRRSSSSASKPGAITPPSRTGELRQRGQRVAQRREVAWTGRQERDARDDALHVRGAAQRPAHGAPHVAVRDQRLDRVVARRRGGHRAQRPRQPLAQEPAAGRGDAAVEQRQQRGRRLAAQRLHDLEAAARGRVEAQRVALVVDDDRGDVRERRLLRRRGVTDERPRRADREWHVPGAERVEVASPELLRQRALCRAAIEVPRRESPRRRARQRLDGRIVVGDEQLRGLEALEQRPGFGQGGLGEAELARREVERRDTRALARGGERREQRVAAGVEQAGVGQRPRRHDPGDAPLDGTLARRRVPDLLDDHRRLAQPDQAGEVRLDRVVGNARHRYRRACGLAPGGQRDVEQARRLLGVAVEQLVEVPHPVEHELVRVPGLEPEVLDHHRRVARRVGHRGRGDGRG